MKKLSPMPSDKDWKPQDLIRSIQGQRISHVRELDGKPRWKVTRAVPGSRASKSDRLFNFDLKLTDGRTLLVLDPYGDESLHHPEIRSFLRIPEPSHFTLGIWRDTGNVVLVTAVQEKGLWALATHEFEGVTVSIPKTFLRHLDELKSSKRPFDFGLVDYGWSRLHSRYSGYSDLEDYFVVKFDFPEKTLEVMGSFYRTVSRWRQR